MENSSGLKIHCRGLRVGQSKSKLVDCILPGRYEIRIPFGNATRLYVLVAHRSGYATITRKANEVA